MSKSHDAVETQRSLCYFLVCYSSVDFVSFLFSSLYRECDIFIIHCDKKAPLELHNYVSDIAARFPNIHCLISQHYSWAGYSHVAITTQAFTLALSVSEAWSHLIVLSEQHLPLRSPDEIAAYLASHKTVGVFRRASTLYESAKADIRNRVGAKYRELPGVGCFAEGSIQHPMPLEDIYHGTNWFIIHREACKILTAEPLLQCVESFRVCVHAEELAMQTALARSGQPISDFDTTFVSLPHLTDNNSLVMTEALFKEAASSNSLFIRKRTKTLTPYVEQYVRGNHFRSEFAVPAHIGSDQPLEDGKARSLATELMARILEERPFADVHSVSVGAYCPSLYLAITTKLMRSDITVRLLSEDLCTFKISIVSPNDSDGIFRTPFLQGNFLHSTIRARIYGMAFMNEMTPLGFTGHGFLSLADVTLGQIGTAVCKVIDVAEQLPC